VNQIRRLTLRDLPEGKAKVACFGGGSPSG
jgi:hypothetical protein